MLKNRDIRMKLENVVPWGRSFSEYINMFCLTDQDLKGNILGCGDGPASFNAELTERGGSVVSIDPVYFFSKKQLRMRIAEVYDEIMPQMEKVKDDYIWKSIASVKELGKIRMLAMNRFLLDYERGKNEKRYIEGALPTLPFEDEQFDLAVCSHYLFLYSNHITLQHHLDAIQELARVAKEVRIYPLVTLSGELSAHIEAVIKYFNEQGYNAVFIESGYQFQKGATKMLVVKRL